MSCSPTRPADGGRIRSGWRDRLRGSKNSPGSSRLNRTQGVAPVATHCVSSCPADRFLRTHHALPCHVGYGTEGRHSRNVPRRSGASRTARKSLPSGQHNRMRAGQDGGRRLNGCRRHRPAAARGQWRSPLQVEKFAAGLV